MAAPGYTAATAADVGNRAGPWGGHDRLLCPSGYEAQRVARTPTPAKILAEPRNPVHTALRRGVARNAGHHAAARGYPSAPVADRAAGRGADPLHVAGLPAAFHSCLGHVADGSALLPERGAARHARDDPAAGRAARPAPAMEPGWIAGAAAIAGPGGHGEEPDTACRDTDASVRIDPDGHDRVRGHLLHPWMARRVCQRRPLADRPDRTGRGTLVLLPGANEGIER